MQALSKAKLRLFRSLKSKKKRYEESLFVAEGEKLTFEAFKSAFSVQGLVVREDVIDKYQPRISPLSVPVWKASSIDFSQISSLDNPEGIMAIVSLPKVSQFTQIPPGPGIILGGIQDPGNAGTILRIAGWFGLKRVLYTPGTVDLYNPKTLRASMGAVFHVPTAMISLEVEAWNAYISQLWLADMEGIPVRDAQFTGEDYLLLGNEAHGIDSRFAQIPGIRKVHIPGSGLAESLNVSVAAGILAYEMMGKLKMINEK